MYDKIKHLIKFMSQQKVGRQKSIKSNKLSLEICANDDDRQTDLV